MRRFKWMVIGSALIAMLVVVACGSAEEEAGAAPEAAAPAQAATGGGATAPQQPAAPAPAAPAQAAAAAPAPAAPVATPRAVVRSSEPSVDTSGQPKMGGTLRIVPQGSLKSLDAQWTTLIVTAHVARHTEEGLFQLDAGFNPQPMLVDDWTTSPDGLTWRFNLREGLKFHDGRPVLASDVVGSFARSGDKAGMWKRMLADYGSTMTAEGDGTIVVTVSESTGLVIDSLHTNQAFAPYIVPEEVWSLPRTESAQVVVGTGPFKFVSWAPGDRWIAERWDDYQPRSEPWSALAGDHTVYLDRMEWIEIPDLASRVAALAVGQVDALDEFKADFAPQIRDNPDLNLFVNTPGNGTSVWLNHVKPPFDDIRARRAVQLAYPMEKALTAAVGDPAFWTLCTNYLACNTRWDTDAGSEGRYNVQDVEAAKALIVEAGLVGTKVRVMQPLDMPVLPDLAAITAEVLEEIGFEVDLQPMDWATLGTRRVDPELWEAFHTWNGIGRVLGPLTDTSLQKDGWFNKYQDTTGRMTELMAAYASAATPEDQKAVWEQINAFAYEDIPIVRIGDFYPPLASRKEVKGWNPIPFPVLWATWLER
jgi:peptide/nickel transport system substrate-binding protein